MTYFTASTSATITKRRADKGQPCFIPRFILNGSDIQPLFETTETVFVYITFTHLMKDSLNLNVCKVLDITFRSAVSNAYFVKLIYFNVNTYMGQYNMLIGKAFLKSISKIAPSL